MENAKYMTEIIMKTEYYNSVIIKFVERNKIKVNSNTPENILQFLDVGTPKDFAKLFLIPIELSKQDWFMENVESIKFFKNSKDGFILDEDILLQILERQKNKLEK